MARRRAIETALAALVVAGVVVGPVGDSLAKRRPEPAVKAKAIEPADLIRVYEAWWDKTYQYMFARGPEPVTMNGGSYGMFEGGVSGILDYGSLNRALARVFDHPSQDSFDRSVIEAVSGVPLLKRESKSFHHDFDRYNPAIVEWGVANLIPDPDAQILGVSAQTLYDRVFRRFFRLKAESYLLLTRSGQYAKQRSAYLRAMKKPRFRALRWLGRRYAGVLPGYHAESAESPLSAAMAIGFWLRRGADGTHEALWKGLTKLLERYDSAWLKAAKKKKYPASRFRRSSIR